MGVDEDSLRKIGAAANALRSYQSLAKLHQRRATDERRFRKAVLIREVAAAWFGTEALSLEDVSRILSRNQRLFHANLADPEDDHKMYGCARSITGVWPLTRETFLKFIEDVEMDWDDLGDGCFAFSDTPSSDCWLGINVVVSVPYIARAVVGDDADSGLGSAVAALGKHISSWTGSIELGGKDEKRLPRLVTTVEDGSKTWEWAEAAGMHRGAKTSYNWTKYWIDLNDVSHLTADSIEPLQTLIKIANGTRSPRLY